MILPLYFYQPFALYRKNLNPLPLFGKILKTPPSPTPHLYPHIKKFPNQFKELMSPENLTAK